MVCKHCGAFLEDGQTRCPLCGMEQTEADASLNEAETAVPEDLPADRAAADGADAAGTMPEDGEAAPEDGTAAAPEQAESLPADEAPAAPARETAAEKPKRREPVWLLVLLALVGVAAVVILIVALTRGGKDAPDVPVDEPSISDGAETPSDGAEQTPDPTAITNVDAEGNFVEHTYTKPDEEITEDMANAVVATCGDAELTNATLSYYYWQQYYNLMSSYGSYISYFLDTTQPLSTQMYDETHTWEDMLLQSAVNAFWQNSALTAAAEEAGFTLDDMYQSYLDSMAESMDANAESGGFDSGDAYLQSFYGPYATVESYTDYARTTFLGSAYLTSLFDDIQYSEDDVSAYYDANAASYAEQNIEKDDTKMVNVRHILIKPAADEGAETDENGSPVLTDQNWADALAKAEELLDLWRSGEATEESFAALATEHSEDPGSVSNGGLYTNVYPKQMAAAFNDWCFDPARQPGDSEIVKTDYGYHIMYFSSVGDSTYWYAKAENDYLTERRQAMLDELVEAAPFTVNYENAVLMESEAM